MSKELDIGKECCDIWNKLKDKTKMIDYLIESKKQVADLEAKLAEKEQQVEKWKQFYNIAIEDFNEMQEENNQLKQQLAEKEKQYQDAVANCVNIANTRAILKLHKVQDRIDDMKSKYECDIEYHLGANNELTHLWEYIDKLIEEMSDGKDV